MVYPRDEAAKDTLNVFLYPNVLETMLRSAHETHPNEASGILCGTFLPTLRIVVIKKAYPCERAFRSQAFVKCREEELFEIDRRRKKDNAGEFYGWYHSHPIGHRLSGINSRSQLKMQKIYGTFLGATIGFDFKDVRFFIMMDDFDVTISHKQFKNENDLFFEILQQIIAFYLQIIDEMKGLMKRPIKVKPPILTTHIEKLIQRTIVLEDDILELKKIADELAEKVRYYHDKVAELKKDLKALSKLGD